MYFVLSSPIDTYLYISTYFSFSGNNSCDLFLTALPITCWTLDKFHDGSSK